MEPPSKRSSPFLPSHTFVLQLTTDVQVESGQLSGRVEHLVSRHATTFQSWSELLAFLAQRLQAARQERGATPTGQGPPAPAS